MNLELDILKLLSNKYNYNKYINYIKEYTLTDKASIILKDYKKMYEEDDKLINIDFNIYITYFDVLHGTFKKEEKELYKTIITNISTTEVSIAVEKILEHYIKLDGVTKAYDQINKILDGNNTVQITDIMDTLDDTLVSLENQTTTKTAEEEAAIQGIIDTDLAQLMASTVLADGYEWRLEDLNISIGSLKPADFVIVAARSEVGKTSFITSETSFMAESLSDDDHILFFNNEEAGAAVQSRYYQSALNKTAAELASDPAKYQAEYTKKMGTKNKIQVLQPDYLDMRYIENKVREYKPKIIIINTLDEVHGVEGSDNGPTKLKKLYVWARELAGKYQCTTFAISQADVSAEGQKYLHQGQLDESKTGKPKTADIIIMIGKEHNRLERFISIPKNKHPSGPRHDPRLSHACHEVEFDELRGRYISKVYKK